MKHFSCGDRHGGEMGRYGKSFQTGVGMLEVLVALLILSIGLLGLALLQAKALASNNTAMARSMATMYSYSIVDGMRIDRANLASYATTVTANNCPAAGSSLSSVQLHQWCVSLGDSLGVASTTTGTIACSTSGTNQACTVTISFVDSHNSTGSTQTVQTRVLL